MIVPSLNPRWRDVALVVSVALALQVILVSWTFPISALATDPPFFYIDGAYHWYKMRVARELGLQGRLTGYDPYFAAGYLGGVTRTGSPYTSVL